MAKFYLSYTTVDEHEVPLLREPTDEELAEIEDGNIYDLTEDLISWEMDEIVDVDTMNVELVELDEDDD